MAGQQNYQYLTQENYFDKAEETLLKQADLFYLETKFGLDTDFDRNKVRHAQLFYGILCTEECGLVDWVWKKINGDLEGHSHKIKMKDFRMFDIPPGQDSCDDLTSCCNWGDVDW